MGQKTLVVGLISDTARAEEARILGEMRQLGAEVLTLAEEGQGLGAGRPANSFGCSRKTMIAAQRFEHLRG